MMATLLNWSDSVFVAQERYAPLIRREPEALRPSLFEPERLLDFRRGECGYVAFGQKKEYSNNDANPKDFDALGDYPVIGDKITHLFRRFALFGNEDWVGEDVTIVHMVRNVRGVVASYLARKQDEKDKWDWGADDALRDWTDAVTHAHEFHEDEGRMARFVVVDYDWMFGGNEERIADVAMHLFDAVGIEFGAKQRRGVARLFRRHKMTPRKPPLDATVCARIDDGVAPATWARYEALCDWSIR